ncbi:hypothetical protein [uncultured Massilia sp.]|uniref:hypothetical protein n=1 Tax=uncultured Massilia sp. TaxID=169973 RepID=UPI0025DCA546|nr:hypothetical protein [uncultured Massilia sp.]
MKNLMWIVLLGTVFCCSKANAQAADKAEACYRRCTTLAFEEPASMKPEFVQKLRSIQEQRRRETDPQKAKALEQEEVVETERMQAALAKSCSKMCKHFD